MPVRELCKKWNKVCSSSFHKQTKSSPTFSSSTTSPSSSTSFFSYYDQQLQSCGDDVVLQQQQQQQQHFWAPTTHTQYEKKYCDETTTSFRLYISEHSRSSKEPKQVVSNSPLLSTTTSTPNSASSSDNNDNNIMETELYLPRFKEFNCENLNVLCNALEQKVPWQKDVIPDIAGTILQCRSGMLRRKEKLRNIWSNDVKEETWLFFQGVDVQAKENIARELAKIIFGSYSKFISVALSSFSSYSTSEDMIKNKRSRDELDSSSYIGRLAQAMSEDPHRVFFVEDVEQVDLCARVGIKRAIQRGRINGGGGGDGDQEVSLSDAIILLSCESFSCRSRACSPPVKQKSDSLEEAGRGEEEEISPCVSLDLNLSFDDDDCNNNDNNESIDDVGILENVDRRIVFRMPEL